MQPRTLDSIYSELGSTYDPQVNSLRQQQAAVPQSVEADIAGARGEQNTAYDNIVSGARRRGIGFSGIPMGEQAQYASNVFAPQVLRYQAQGRQQAASLEDAVLGLNTQRRTQAQGIYDNDRNFAEQQRQFNEQMAYNNRQAAAARAAASSFNPSFGGANPTLANGQQPQQKGGGVTLQSFLSQKMQQQPTAPRLLQDQWVRQWAQLTGKNEGDNSIWQAYNQILPWDKFNDNANRSLWLPKLNVKPTVISGGLNATNNPLFRAASPLAGLF